MLTINLICLRLTINQHTGVPLNEGNEDQVTKQTSENSIGRTDYHIVAI